MSQVPFEPWGWMRPPQDQDWEPTEERDPIELCLRCERWRDPYVGCAGCGDPLPDVSV